MTASAVLLHTDTAEAYGLKRIPEEELSFPEDYLLLYADNDAADDEGDVFLPAEESEKEEPAAASSEPEEETPATESTPLIAMNV